MINILVIDGQGGGVGAQLVSQIKTKLTDAEIIAVGTNSAAAQNMGKAGADHIATGENAVVVNARRADYIIGPIGIVIADAMYGEITPAMAHAAGASEAYKILIPSDHFYGEIAGTQEMSVGARIRDAVHRLICQVQNSEADG